MPRVIQSQVILAKVQTVQGTDAAPGNTTDAVLARSVDIQWDQQFATRSIIRGFYGADDMLPTIRRGTVKLSVDLQHSGTAGTAPQWGDLMIGCAAAEGILATPARVEYTPVSTGRKWLTIWAYKDGLLYKFQDCMGTCVLNLDHSAVPTLDFTFTGLVVTDPAATANPVPTLTAWIRPLAASPANTAKLNLGGTYAAGVVTGGASFDLKNISLDLGNDVRDLSLLTTETVDIFNHAPKIKLVGDFTAALEATWLGNLKGGATTPISLIHGTAAGFKVGFYAPAAVLTKMTNEADGNLFLTGMELTAYPTSAGNDDWRIFGL